MQSDAQLIAVCSSIMLRHLNLGKSPKQVNTLLLENGYSQEQIAKASYVLVEAKKLKQRL